MDFAEFSLTLIFPFIEEHIFPCIEPSGKDIMLQFLNDAGQIYYLVELLSPSNTS